MDNMKKVQEVMMTSIFDVFEKMFFVFLEPWDDDFKYDMATSIHFSGTTTKGEIKAYLSAGVVRSMVQNMLSLEPEEVTDGAMEDCAKEALNMIAGSFLNKMDAKQVFDLSIPEYEKKTDLFKKTNAASLSLIFDSDDNYLAITMNLEPAK